MKSKVRRQPPVQGGRESLPSCVLKEIMMATRKEAARWNCSRSYVVATILAHHFGIDMVPYTDTRKQ